MPSAAGVPGWLGKDGVIAEEAEGDQGRCDGQKGLFWLRRFWQFGLDWPLCHSIETPHEKSWTVGSAVRMSTAQATTWPLMTEPLFHPTNEQAVGEPVGPAIVIGGMHRSGTSLLASLFEGAGVAMGERLLGNGNGNEAGHYEDLDFQQFHERVLVGSGLSAEGFTADALPVISEVLREEATSLIEARRATAGLWGWKDPRTVLFLDFWNELLPEATFVFIFRRPWDVAESFFRRGDPAYVYNPPHAARVWLHYNRQILQFVSRYPERCVVREITQVIANPAELFATLRERFSLALNDPPARYRPELLHTDHSGALAKLIAASCPEAVDVYLRLRHQAHSSSRLPCDSGVVLADLAVMQWAKASRLDQDNAAVRREWMSLQASLASLSSSIRDLASRPDVDRAIADRLAEMIGEPSSLRAA